MTETTRSDVTRREDQAHREQMRREDPRRDDLRREDKRRSVKEGIGFGLIAGAIFAVAQMLAAVASGQPAVTPFRMFSGLVAGSGALEFGAVAALVTGAIVGLVLSALFGALYGLINSKLPLESHTSMGTQTVFGLIFGAALWLVMFQIIARVGVPWWLDANQFAQFILHAVFFGLPLGLMFAAAERRAVLRPGYHAAPQHA